MPLSGFIVTTPPFTFGWFVEFKCMQIMRWNANTLIWLVLVNNLMFTSIIFTAANIFINSESHPSVVSPSKWLLNCFFSSFQVLGRLKRNFESSLICFLCFFSFVFHFFILLRKQEDILIIQLNRNMLTFFYNTLDQCTIQYCLISFLVAPNFV